MQVFSFLAVAALTGAPSFSGQVPDTASVETLEQAVVQGVRVQKNAPYAVANVDRKSLESFSGSGKELPFLLSLTPGVMSWSENGLGTGTSYMRIRGAGDSRINVTVDGVPLNSPEDQCVFWANMNSYSSLMDNVQIQRGVGSSTNGDGAFGGSISMQTKAPSYDPYVELNASYGSYNTYNTGIALSTGLLGNHFVGEGAFHMTGTDGFVHGTSGKSGSWFGGLTWLGRDFTIRYKNIGNYEHTGQAWSGVTAGSDDLSLMDGTYGESTGIRTYKDMYKAGLGRYNSLYESIATDGSGAFAKDADGKYMTARHTMLDGSFWPRTTDNFWQDHNILSLSWNIDERWKTSLSLHYTYGYGYYKEFRPGNKLSKFGFASFTDKAGNKLKRSDFIRKKGLAQNAGGAVYNISYRDGGWDVVGGLSAQLFRGNHFGYLTYVSNPAVTAHYGELAGLNDMDLKNGKYKYYDSDAQKDDYSAFVKASRTIGEHFTVFADLQYRHVRYVTDGLNDKFVEQEDGSYQNQRLDVDKNYDFFNPKAGVSYTAGAHKVYASVAMSNREPERNNFTDNGSYPAPKAEHLNDYEAGYQYSGDVFHAGVNFYYMDYVNQFVQTGAQSDIGESLTTNIKDSYRAGAELTAGVKAARWLSLEANAALSANRIKDFDEVVEDWDNGSQTIHYDNSTLAFSPSAIVNGFAFFSVKGVQATWHTGFVSRQYLDNTENKDRSLPAYTLSDVSFSYPVKLRGVLKEITLGLDVNNVFNARVATSGWVYSAIYASGGHPNDNRYYQIGFIPMSGTTVIGKISLRF
jgi:iron complex outermembrane recepter protein